MKPSNRGDSMQTSTETRRPDWRQRRLTRAFVFGLAWWHAACYAVDFPSVPLQTGVTQPAPNVIFILDDSLSMEGTELNTGLVWSNTSPGIGNAAYTKNPLAYNPRTTYKPWATANDKNTEVERLDDATYTKVCEDTSRLTSCSKDLSSSAQTFYVPKKVNPTATELADQRQYYRYQILKDGTTMRLIRARWWYDGAGLPPASSKYNSSWNCSKPSNSKTAHWADCEDISNDGDPDRGVRKLAEEMQNYANWYQYHRTRMKAAKAGGAEAFASLDENFRVGIMGLYPSGSRQQVINGSANASAPDPSKDDPGNLKNIIPVDSNGGLFVGKNRVDWFKFLHDMDGEYVTPLRKALDAAGKYFSTSRAYRSTDSNGTVTYLACRQNFAILTTDGYWNNYNGEDPDSAYKHISGDEEKGEVITGPNNQKYQYLPTPPYWYNDNYGDTSSLADIAMHYWKTDLLTRDVTGYSGSAENRVPFSVANPAFWQHMVTFGVGFGVKGKLTDAEVAKAMAGTGYWPKPKHTTGTDEPPENIDDLRHAAVNGHGSYVNANNPEEFTQGIADALNRIGERRGSASNVLANSTSISTESFVYQATYTAGAWRGELLAYPISAAGLGQPEWRAGEKIPAWNSRKIFTFGGSGGSTFPSTQQLTELGAPATSLGLPSATALANYLKGDGSNEKRNNGVLRDRTMRNSSDQVVPALLGDIVDSSPYYVADTQTLYVGANDGMLHAIDASTTASAGTEVFTYIPRGVKMNELADLADPLYGTNEVTKPHRYFVDGPIVVSARSRTPNRNYLVGAMGRGGRGVFGLDVTDPKNFGADDVLWDLTGSAAPTNMGNVIAEPLISKLNNGKTAAVVANGPNSDSGTASLFLLDLDTGATIKELDTGETGDNGLSPPRAVDINADGIVDYFFAGDLKGNLWRFNVSTADDAQWKVDLVFTATGPDDEPQSITGGLAVARDPSTSKIWVFFGTGRYMTVEDQKDRETQSFYGVIVGQSAAEGEKLTRADLRERTIHLVDASTGRRSFEVHQNAVGAGYEGWFIDLEKPADTGERVISAPLIYDTVLIFSSVVPPRQEAVNSCEAGGSGYVNALSAFSGTSLQDSFFEIPEDTIDDVPVGSLPIGSGMPTAPIIVGDKLVVGDSSGGAPTAFDVSGASGNQPRRVSWREIFNF
jgi:type IV pilus assembly protein PilY1